MFKPSGKRGGGVLEVGWGWTEVRVGERERGGETNEAIPGSRNTVNLNSLSRVMLHPRSTRHIDIDAILSR